MSKSATHLRKGGLREALLAGVLLILLGGVQGIAASSPSDDLAIAPSNQSIIITPLTNDNFAGSNQAAILQVTKPAHGTVTISSNAAVLTPQLSNLFAFAAIQMSNTVVQVNSTNLYPRRTLPNGTWSNVANSDWVSGFFPGTMWYIYEHTHDTNFLNWARKWTAGISSQKNVTTTDDIGFMFNTSFGTGFRISGDTNYRSILLTAANSLSTRYSSTVRSIEDDRTLSPTQFEVILDTMMNGDLLYYMTDVAGDTNYAWKIYNHQLRAMTNQVRLDGSTYHRAVYGRSTGALVFQGTRAGYADWSTWSRGHSWAIYMFTKGYIETGYQPFLDTAQRVSDYYVTNVPADFVPYWDYQAPNIPNEPRDSSAAAVALSGMLQLSQVVTNQTNAAKYWLEAHNIFESLASTNYLATGTSNKSILLHGTGETPVLPQPETNVGLIYGDYYFVESMHRYAVLYGQTNLIYTPNAGFTGTDTFCYTVGDSAGNLTNAIVTVVVQPTNSAPPFAATVAAPPAVAEPLVSFPTVSGYLYDVQYRDDVANGAWQILKTNVLGTGGTVSVADPGATNTPTRVYRVMAH